MDAATTEVLIRSLIGEVTARVRAECRAENDKRTADAIGKAGEHVAMLVAERIAIIDRAYRDLAARVRRREDCANLVPFLVEIEKEIRIAREGGER